jgi:threonine synthase
LQVTPMNLAFLSCSRCSERYEPGTLSNLCARCGKPLLAQYDLERAARALTPASLAMRVATLWRCREVLPVAREENITTLGEGWTPLIHAQRLGKHLGAPIVTEPYAVHGIRFH